MTTEFIIQFKDISAAIHVVCVLAQVGLICYYNYNSKKAIQQARINDSDNLNIFEEQKR
jgi:hypothetical protein